MGIVRPIGGFGFSAAPAPIGGQSVGHAAAPGLAGFSATLRRGVQYLTTGAQRFVDGIPSSTATYNGVEQRITQTLNGIGD